MNFIKFNYSIIHTVLIVIPLPHMIEKKINIKALMQSTLNKKTKKRLKHSPVVHPSLYILGKLKIY